MDRYADVIIDIAHEKVDRPFQYRIPDRLSEEIRPGCCVNIPFGMGNTLRKGYVIEVDTKLDYDPAKIKDIHSVVSDSIDAENGQFKLAMWMKENYGGTLIQALKTVLPVKSKVAPKQNKEIVLSVSKEEAISILGEAIRKKQKAKVRLLEQLINEERLPKDLVTGKLMVSSQTISSLERDGILKVEVSTSYRNPVKNGVVRELPPLSEGQQEVVDTVLEEYDSSLPRTYLLHGITGSGKTNVYISLAKSFVERGKQVIVLIPEISLTYQTLLRFYQVFEDRVSVMNSSLSAGERFDQCERAKHGEIDVMIGPRSALFVPFQKLGLIIMDEEHEGTYKCESTPKFHTRETAIQLASFHGASVLLGSATPSLESYEKALRGEYGYFTLTERLTGGALPNVSVVDLREELKNGNRSIFSERLQELMQDRLNKQEQIILFINRRGYAGFISCRACGEVIKCPHCDVSLSSHNDGKMVCHYCGYTIPTVKKCPKCGSGYVFGFRAGTEQIEEKIKEMYPKARVLRMDADTTKTKESYEKLLSTFGNGEADILVGTQMIVKGHDFPNVTLVGILAADLSLGVNDFRSGEKTFQLITQAAGRAGRGQLPGEVVVQTYQPEHYAILSSAKQSYSAFYEEESIYRDMMGYPPYIHMLAIQVLSYDNEDAMKLSKLLAEKIRGREDYMVLGPAEAGIGKIKDVYRFVTYVKNKDYAALVEVKNELEKYLRAMEGRRSNVLFDFDPMNIM